jgi:hypothetical protein
MLPPNYARRKKRPAIQPAPEIRSARFQKACGDFAAGTASI